MNKKKRLFVGIPLTSELRKRLKREIQTFPELATLPTATENLHVTLFFIGFVHEEQVAEICAKVGEACEGHAAFQLEFTSMKLMDSDENPKMIWLAGEVSEELKSLREDIEKSFASFVTEKKAFRPHVTLAKIKKQKWLGLPEKPALKEKVHLVEPVDTVAVFESVSIDGKRRYEQIDTFVLE